MTARSPYAIALLAASVFALGLGLRLAQPLFISPLNSHTGIGYATISFAFGVAQLMWGVAQPIAGAMADRFGTRRVMLAGVVLLAASSAAIPLARSALVLTLLIGVLAASGAGTLGPAMLIATANRWIPEAKRSVTAGIVNAGGSFGQFALVPLAQLLIATVGWQAALVLLGVVALGGVPLVWSLTTRAPSPSSHAASGAASLRAALRGALRDRSFLLLNAGFFTCGFHIAFLTTHLPGVVSLCGLPESVGAWSLSIIGLFNLLGSLWIGRAIRARSLKFALAWIYLTRAMLIIAFFFAPKTPLAFFLFAGGIGFTYLSTLPPTVGLVAKLLGARYLATLFGIVMVSHQIGGFLGAWLGGKAFEATHGYDVMWWADIMLCVVAAVVHLPIREVRTMTARAATS